MRFVRFFMLFILSIYARSCGATHDMAMTVFIHGTFGIRAQLKLTTLHHILRDTLPLTPQKKVVHHIRTDPYFFKIQPIQELGLQPIAPCTGDCSTASLFAHVYDRVAQTSAPDAPASRYYTYGWSGLLSHRERHHEAGVLYAALAKELASVKRTNPHARVHLRLVGYSHGGSVALHLAQHTSTMDTREQPLVIDELVLLGTPIQPETEQFLHHSLFKKVYNFYSQQDFVQAFDCFSQHSIFSRRCFKKKSLHEKLVQVEVRVMGCKYPNATRYPIDRSPNHTEWWFFGWTFNSYRKNCITYPLPLAAFIPCFIDVVAQCAPNSNHLTLTIQPDGKAHVKAKKHGSCCHAQWIDPKKLTSLTSYALQHAPEMRLYEHEAHFKSALKSTREGLAKLQLKYQKACLKHAKQGCLCGTWAYDLP